MWEQVRCAHFADSPIRDDRLTVHVKKKNNNFELKHFVNNIIEDDTTNCLLYLKNFTNSLVWLGLPKQNRTIQIPRQTHVNNWANYLSIFGHMSPLRWAHTQTSWKNVYLTFGGWVSKRKYTAVWRRRRRLIRRRRSQHQTSAHNRKKSPTACREISLQTMLAAVVADGKPTRDWWRPRHRHHQYHRDSAANAMTVEGVCVCECLCVFLFVEDIGDKKRRQDGVANCTKWRFCSYKLNANSI